MAQEFAKALDIRGVRHEGYLESGDSVVTWCVGHLVTMSYPEKYDIRLKKWSFETLPFLPDVFLYEIIPEVRKQFEIVKGLLNRPDVATIYVCTDSGREGEYIYRLVAQMAGVRDKDQRRVWIDSQTREEILRGIREAKALSAYDQLSDAAYLRAKEDYLMGINFSRALSLKYGGQVSAYLGGKYQAIAVGRVMTCVLGMVVRREREIRVFVKTPFYRIISSLTLGGETFEGEWRAVEGTRFYQSPLLYKDNGFRKKEDAENLLKELSALPPEATVLKIEKKKENKNPPLLFNLAELQNVCSKLFKISPDETLRIVQELYEKKLVTYPRTDARVLSTAVAKEISKNLAGLKDYPLTAGEAAGILENERWKNIAKTRYTNDKQITDHYAIIPTGQGLGALGRQSVTAQRVYEVIVRRFLSIFFPPAVYQKINLVTGIGGEQFFSSFKVLVEKGYLQVAQASFASGKEAGSPEAPMDQGKNREGAPSGEAQELSCDETLLNALKSLKKGARLPVEALKIKEGETSPPKRYNSGSMILAMENAGQLIEDEELRSQIRSSGIGTSATRAEILKKLFTIRYLSLNKKTQMITPTQLGEMIYDVVAGSIRSLLNPELTASWEKGLTYVAEGSITADEYMRKLKSFVAARTEQVRNVHNEQALQKSFDACAPYYSEKERKKNVK